MPAYDPPSALSSPASFHAGFDVPEALDDSRTEGDVALDPVRPYKGAASLRFARAKEHMDSRPTSVVLRAFPVCEGRWDLSGALRGELHSPDSSYNGTVRLDLLDAAEAVVCRREVAIITGKADWQKFKKTVELGPGIRSARFTVSLEKAYGQFWVDELAAQYRGPVLRSVAAIRFASRAVGNLFLPSDPVRFQVTVECIRPLPSTGLVLTCTVRDYWGSEFAAPRTVGMVAAGMLENGRHAYRADVDLAGLDLAVGKYFEIHGEVPEPDLPEPTVEASSFAILPEAATKAHAPFDVPFTASGWNPGVPGFFPLCDRLGLRVADVYSRWSAEPPYEVQAPGIEIVRQLGMGALMSTMAFIVEGRRPGYEKYDRTALFEGARRLVATYKDQLPIAIRNGNEPHPADDAQALEMIACYQAIYEGVKAADPSVIVTSTSCGAEEQFFRLGFQRFYDVYDFHQYADAGVIPGDFERYERLVAKYGMRKPVWSTEIGLNSQGMARSAVAIQMIKIFTMFFACGGENASWFGIMWPDPDGSNVGTNGDSFDVFNSKYCLYSPKLTAITEYNMVNAICVKRIVASRTYADGTFAALFRDLQGQCLLVAWRDAGRREVALPMPGVHRVRATRLDGSANDLAPGRNGLTLALSEEPYLLQFESATFGLPEDFGPPRATLDTTYAPVVKGGETRIRFHHAPGDAARIELEAPPRWTLHKHPTSNGTTTVFQIAAPSDTTAREGRLRAWWTDGGGELALAVPVVSPIAVRLVPAPFVDGKAGMTLTIHNHGATARKVRWTMAFPETYPMAGGTFRLNDPLPFVPVPTGPVEGVLEIAPKTGVPITVRLANLAQHPLHKAVVDLAWDGGTLHRERLFGGCAGVPRVTGGVAFDGRLGDSAWEQSPVLTLDEESQYAILTRTTARRDRPEDLSATMRLLWDDRFLYLGLRVRDDVHAAPECDAGIWRGDGLQFLVDPCRESDDKPGKYDYALGLGTKGAQAWCYSTADAARAPTEEVKDFRMRITPTGDRGDMVYEVAIPWHRIAPFKPEPGANLGLAMIVNDDDGHIRDSFIAWFGCAHSKQMSMNGDLILLA